MKLSFFISLALVLYTYAGYPVCIALLARIRCRPWTKGPHTGPASVILPVHNGMAMLPEKMASLRSINPDLIHEIIVVCDGCSDGTDVWLETWNDSRVTTLILPKQVGKATALRRGMSVATGEFLLFVDVRPTITGDAICKLLRNFADPAVGCVAGELKLRQSQQASQATAAVGGLYWRYEQWIRNNESAYDSPVGVYGGFYAVRRSLAVAPPDGLILDDMFQPLSIIRQGYRSVVDTEALVYDSWPSTAGGELQRKVRTLAGNFQLVALASWVLSLQNRVLLQLVSHKFLRLLVPYCFIVMLLCSLLLAIHSRLWFLLACMQATAWTLSLAALRVRLPVLGKAAGAASALLVLNAAAIRALWVFAFAPEPLWKIWTPVKEPTSQELLT